LGKNQTGHKDIEFSLTTNGSLITDKMLEFFNRHRFTLTLSFDGLAQEMGREKGSFEKTLRAMKRIREHPDINFEINSVFSPLTVPLLSESLHFIIEQGGPEITFNLSALEYWNPEAMDTLKKELQRLTDFLAVYYREKGKMPVKNFQAPAIDVNRGVFRCSAGNEQMSLAPDGKVWGCFLFHDYFKTRQNDPQYWDYCFGDFGDFIEDYGSRYVEKLVNYCQLQQDLFQVEGKGEFCFLCKELPGCMVCPVYAAYSTGALGKISCQHCAVMKIQNQAMRFLEKEISIFN
jgi:sulfatase maturation enzyme AslB (radical SAM superfamily)